MSNRLVEIMKLGQSIWYDNIRRAMLSTGDLRKKIEEDDLRGVTSNPTIFEKAITGSTDYDEQLRGLVQAGKGVSEIYEDLVVEDITSAADTLKPVYDKTDGLDGYISLEVNPKLAYDTQGTIDEASRLFERVGRKNVMIKIPASQEGLPAIEESIYRGININITMIFSLENYEQVAEAFIKGLERRAAEGKNVDHIASVASFFVSRVDTAIDADLEYKARHASSPEEKARLEGLCGRAAVANAKLAYEKYKQIFHGERFAALRAKGAQTQRCLWASTGTKNPKYSDVLYVDNLIGPETVNTVPPATYTAIRDHGKVALTLEEGLDECRTLIAELAELGIDLKAVTEKLQRDGLAAFVGSFDTLVESIESKRDALLSGINERVSASLGKYADAVSAAIREAEKGDVMRRVWRKDAALWKSEEEHQKIIKNSLGWLNVADVLIGVEDDLISFADRLREQGLQTRRLKRHGRLLARARSPAPHVREAGGFPRTACARLDRPGHGRRIQGEDRPGADALRRLVEVGDDDRAADVLPLLVRRGRQGQGEPGRELPRRHRPRHEDGSRRDARQVQAHLRQPVGHRRALLGALLLRDGAGGLDGRGHQEAARPRRARHARLLAGRPGVREPGRAARGHHRRVREGGPR